jgi:hypothetical protein
MSLPTHDLFAVGDFGLAADIGAAVKRWKYNKERDMNKTEKAPKYLDVYDNRDHIEDLLSWLLQEVISAGGDGDGIWYSKYYDVRQIAEVFLDFFKFHKWKIEMGYDTLFISPEHPSQEGLVITNNKKTFDQRPSWQQVAIQY